MSELFTKIEPREIEQFSSDDLTRLLHRLLHCEARNLSLQKTHILVPAQTTVPDGARDGLWNAEIGEHEFIPRTLTYYQCKAEHVTASICRDEMVTELKDKVTKKTVFSPKPRVQEVLSQGGCYAFFSSKHEIKPAEANELDTVARTRLADAGFTPSANACIEFFGCNRIADWVNKFPAAVRFVREVTKGFGGVHYYTVEGWSKLARSSGPFYQTELLAKKIEVIRDALGNGETRIVRFIGLSGVGKTRLLLETFRADAGSDSQQRSLSDSTIYVSFGDMRDNLLNFVAHLADNCYSAIVVVDDCPPDIHERLVQIAGTSALSLVTAFHQPEPTRRDSHLLTLEPSEMENVVEQILRADVQLGGRGEEAIKAVAAFCEGFPQIAILITEFHRAPTLEELRDREPLMQKLISKGETPDANTLSAMQALAMCRTIGGSATILDTDLELIRQIFCEQIAEMDFRRLVQQQLNREVVQQIADTMMVVPRPLAVALAADFIPIYPAGRWKEAIQRLSEGGLLDSFTSRIEELEFSERGVLLGKLLLDSGLPFADAEYLLTGTTGSQMFRALCMLNPSAAMEKVSKTLSQSPLDSLREAKAPRRHLVRAFEFAAWEPDTFPQAARLLLRLAAAENEGWANNATGGFQQLFTLHLSGTKMPATERLAIIHEALQETEQAVRLVAIKALGRGLTFRLFSRMGGETLSGKRDALQDWRPTTNRQALDYWKECYLILRSIIAGGGPDAAEAKRVLGENFATLLQQPLVDELDEDFERLALSLHRLWPEAKGHIKRALELNSDTAESERAGLLRWKQYLTPTGEALDDRLRDVVSQPGWHHRKSGDGHYADVSQEEAERLAADVIKQDMDLTPHLSQLLIGEQQQAFSFGVALGKSYRRVGELINSALNLWPHLNVNLRNSSLLNGVMRGVGNQSDLRTETLEKVDSTQGLADLLIPLSGSVDSMAEIDFLRIRKAVEEGRVEPWRLRNLIQGQPMRRLSDEFVTVQFRQLLHARPEAAQSLFEVLWLHCHGEAGKFDRFIALFAELLLQKGLPVLDGHFAWEWHEAAKVLLERTEDKQWLRKVAEYIRDALLNEKKWARTNYLAEVTARLFEKAPAETWPVFAERLRDGDEIEKYVLTDFLGSIGSPFDNTDSLIWKLPAGQFREWVRTNRDLIPLILSKMSLYTVEKHEGGDAIFRWHPYAKLLVEEGVDEKELEGELAGNLISFGSTGSRVPYLEKRLGLVQDLECGSEPKLKRIGSILGEWLRKEIETTRRQESNEAARYR